MVSSQLPERALLSLAERQWRAALTLCLPLALGAAPVLVSMGGVTLCGFRHFSGLPCPLCGGTHACAALAEGNFAAAWQANPGLAPLFAIVAVHAVQLAYEAWFAKRLGRWRIGVGTWVGAGVWLASAWILRLAGQI